MARLVACPRCGASPPSAPASGAAVTCQYCGAIYRIDVPTAPAAPTRSSSATPIWIAVGLVGAVVLVVLVIAGLGAAAYFARAPTRSSPQRTVLHAQAAGALLSTERLSVPAPPPEAPATAKFDFQSRKPSVGSSFYALGFVTNTSPYVIGKPKVTVVMKDASGKEVGSNDGYAESDALSPGARSPIKILVKDPVSHATLAFEVTARKATYVSERVEGLKIATHQEKRPSLGSSWEALGKVEHTGQVPAKFVRVQILSYRQNKLIGVDSTFADAEVLLPGGSARFKGYLLLGQEPDRFELSVEARAAR